MAVTGAASSAGQGSRVLEQVRAVSDVPSYIGIGVSSPAQASAACDVADGVIVGTAVLEALSGGGPLGVEEFVRSLRTATQ
jgi:tryptophan synthase alpha chain